MRKGKRTWLGRHSLSVVAVGLLLAWIIGYVITDEKTRLGIFFGNAIADWSGSVMIILGTKFFYEVGSAESKPIRHQKRNRWLEFLREHSLFIFIAITGMGWLLIYFQLHPTQKWGQVVGNILSEWLQMVGLVFLTKELVEKGSKESRR